MNVGRGARARERSLEAANEMQAQAKTRAQREEAEYQVKRAKHLIQWCEAASNIRPQKFKRIDAAVKARDELPGELDPGYDSEAYNAANKHAEDVWNNSKLSCSISRSILACSSSALAIRTGSSRVSISASSMFLKNFIW